MWYAFKRRLRVFGCTDMSDGGYCDNDEGVASEWASFGCPSVKFKLVPAANATLHA